MAEEKKGPPKPATVDRMDDMKLEDIAKEYKDAVSEDGAIEIMEDVADHAKNLYNAGESYLNKFLPVDKPGTKRLGLTHLKNDIEKEKHAKAMAKEFAKYLIAVHHADPKTKAPNTKLADEIAKNDQAVKDFLNVYMRTERIQGYQGLVNHLKNVKGLRGDMSDGELKKAFRYATTRMHAKTLTKESAEEHFSKTRNYDSLHKMANGILKDYGIEAKYGAPVEALTYAVQKSTDKNHKFTADEVPEFYAPVKKKAA